MRHYKEQQVIRTEQVEERRPTCDVCGEDIAYEYGRRIEVKNTLAYEHGSTGSSERYDVCTSCWETEIVSLMKNPPTRSEW